MDRCRKSKKVCKFMQRPTDPYNDKIEALQNQVTSLKARIETPTHVSIPSLLTDEAPNPFQAITPTQSFNTTTHNSMGLPNATPLKRRRRSHFVTNHEQLPDFVTSSLLTDGQAKSYFSTFFQGCDHYVPIFDAEYDTYDAIKSRSSLLFGAICTVGCRIQLGTESHQWRLLNFQLKRMLNHALTSTTNVTLETVQALIVQACYSSERSLLVATATRIAVDIGLPDSYDDLLTQLATNTIVPKSEHLSTLMRQSRTWLHLLVLGHLLHVDAGDLLTFEFSGDVRRSRILLQAKGLTILDRFLLAQVELNVLRCNAYSSLCGLDDTTDEDVLDVVHDFNMDIELWYNDWARIFQDVKPTPPWLLVNLKVQRCWAETITLSRAVRKAGVENVDFMSEAQRSILVMAKKSLSQHLDVILQQPRTYLYNLRFAMDFVWAKCAFCYLLLLKLSILIPDDSSQRNQHLIQSGHSLVEELDATNTGKVYLQILRTGIDKFTRATQDTSNAGGEMDAFLPDQFVFEWDFPGLTLFSSTTTGIGWLDDILLGAFSGDVSES